MKKFKDLMEAPDTIVFAFGRFNPPTTGHEKLIQKTAAIAGSNPFRIYPSFTTNPKKDPLPHALKIAYMRKMFSKYKRNIIADKDAKTAIHIAVKLYDEGFKNLVMVAGSDRLKEFDTLLNSYNGVEGKRHGYYKFDSIDIVSAGERDPDAEGVEGMSASKMRAAASNGDMDSFLQGVPSGFSDGKKLYRDVRKYMGIREDRDMGDMTDFETLRDAYLTGQIWNVGDTVETNGLSGEIVRKGTNYLSFVTEDGKVHKAWLHDIEFDEEMIYEIFFLAPAIPYIVAAVTWVGGVVAVKLGPELLAIAGLTAMIHSMLPVAMGGGLLSVAGWSASAKIAFAAKLAYVFLPHFLSLLATGVSLTVALKTMNKKVKDKVEGMTPKEIAKLPAKSSDKAKVKKVVKSKEFKLIMKKAKIDEDFIAERNYAKEYQNYHSQPEQREKNAARLRARRLMVKNGKVTKFDDMDVHHKDNNPLNNEEENLEVTTKKWNRTEPRLRDKIDLSLDEMAGLTPEVIERLRISFKKVKRFDSKSPSGKKIIDFIGARTDKDLKSIQKAKIKHLSDLAKLELKRRKKGSKTTLHDLLGEVAKSRPRAGGPKSIEKSIKKHIELTNKYIKQGMNKDAASKKAFKDIVKEEVEFDEEWWNKAIAKLNQISHPKNYGKMVQSYAELMRQDKYKKRPNMAADKVAREYSGVSVREFIKYINTLVAKKILPQELKAEYVKEEWSFKDFVHQIQKGPIKEVLAKDADMGDYIDDFVKSDAPQFNGKSKEKRKEMAIAAYYAKKESLET